MKTGKGKSEKENWKGNISKMRMEKWEMTKKKMGKGEGEKENEKGDREK